MKKVCTAIFVFIFAFFDLLAQVEDREDFFPDYDTDPQAFDDDLYSNRNESSKTEKDKKKNNTPAISIMPTVEKTETKNDTIKNVTDGSKPIVIFPGTVVDDIPIPPPPPPPILYDEEDVSLDEPRVIPKGHLKFMGIELDGNINDFHEKLIEKGLSYQSDREVQQNERVYKGVFSGDEAEIFVFFNPRTRQVFRAKAVLTRFGKDAILQEMRDYEVKLDAKYGKQYKSSELFKDDNNHSFYQYSYDTGNGNIGLFITSTQIIDQSIFYLHIDYHDTENYVRSKVTEMEDL